MGKNGPNLYIVVTNKRVTKPSSVLILGVQEVGSSQTKGDWVRCKDAKMRTQLTTLYEVARHGLSTA